MTGHTLGIIDRCLSERGTHFEAACQCGILVQAPRMWQVWEAHDTHVRHVGWLSRQRHPSGGAA